jgi:hypothetical protein
VGSTDGLSVAQHTTTGTLAPKPSLQPGHGQRRAELATYDISKDDLFIDGGRSSPSSE